MKILETCWRKLSLPKRSYESFQKSKYKNNQNFLLLIIILTFLLNNFQISSENGLPNLVCDYCHNLILQFYGYFETVNANQDELMTMMVNVEKEKIFAVPIVKLEQKPDSFSLGNNTNVHSDDDDRGWFDHDELMNSPVEEHGEQPSSPEILELPQRPYQRREVLKVEYSKEELSKLNYFELKNLPINFAYSYLCPLCPETNRFRIRTDLTSHILKTHDTHLPKSERVIKAQTEARNVEPQCDVCYKIISKSKHNLIYQDHKFVHYGINPYKCELCKFTAPRKDIIRQHIMKHKAQMRRQGCYYCPRNFLSNDLRNKHIRERHLDKLISCDLCGETLLAKHLAEDHFREHQNNSLMLECERCIGGIRLPDERVLALHKKQHEREGKYRKGLACHLCERTFKSEHAFKAHLGYHADGKISACPVCGKSITIYDRTVSSHALSHLKKKPKTLKCNICDSEFRDRNSLAHHFRSVHERKEQSCYKCGKMIAKYLMKTHLKRCTAGDIRCTHCPMIFAKESERTKHTNAFHIGYYIEVYYF